jgi:hypothetical protein
MTKLNLKPHHFADIICSFGNGKREFKPHPYGNAVHSVSELLLRNPRCQIAIKTAADDICVPCIHNIEGKCIDEIDNSYRPKAPKSKQEWNLLIDLRWCEHLDIKQGDVLDTGELCKRIDNNVRNLFTIYPEIPTKMTEKRKSSLIKGLQFFNSILSQYS